MTQPSAGSLFSIVSGTRTRFGKGDPRGRAGGGGGDGRFTLSRCPPVATFGKKPRMKHQIAHDLDMSLAKEAAVHAFESYQKRFVGYHPKMYWIGDRDARIEFSIKGFKLQRHRARPRRPFRLSLVQEQGHRRHRARNPRVARQGQARRAHHPDESLKQVVSTGLAQRVVSRGRQS